jgi:hypothetical protein
MRLCHAIALSLILSSTVSGLASAAPAAPAKARAASSDQDADSAARVGKSKEFIYDDEEIDGDSLHPDHERIDFRPPGKHPSLIQVRSHFIPQLLRMATDV